MNKWVKRGILVVVLVLAPIVMSNLMEIYPFNKVPGENSDWFAFLGGYLGAILTVGGVYYQISSENKNNEKLEFRKSRPYFAITIKGKYDTLSDVYFKNEKDKNNALKNITAYEASGAMRIRYHDDKCVRIQNASTHHAFSLQVKIECENEENIFRIQYIKPYQEIYFSVNTDGIMSVELTFLSELREKERIYFLSENNLLVHKKDLSRLESDMNEREDNKKFSDYNPNVNESEFKLDKYMVEDYALKNF
ncbi:hypothetical protein [Latilactobacillus fuchuensis]|nr:hypothetical protein [Latilactobacillus fuchuensis]